MTRNQSLGFVGVIALTGFVAFVLIFVVMSASDGEADVLGVSDDPTATAVSETPSPTIYVSPTLTDPQPTAAVPDQAVSNQVSVVTPVAQAATASDCVVRSDLPPYIVQDGDILSAIAEGVGATVEELIVYNCLVNEDQLEVGQTLYVPTLPDPAPTVAEIVVTPTPAVNVVVVTQTSAPNVIVVTSPPAGQGGATIVCESDWFFAFEQGQADLLNACPDSATSVEAIGQNFENGRIYVYDSPPLTPDTRGIGFVIYNDGTWEAYLDTWVSNDPLEDPNLVPPGGFFQPTAAIGKIWRENPILQDTLGWAIEAPEPFVGRTQLPSTESSYFYIDHGVEGYVLRLTTSEESPNTWELVGLYS